jgi:hypothetical protein
MNPETIFPPRPPIPGLQDMYRSANPANTKAAEESYREGPRAASELRPEQRQTTRLVLDRTRERLREGGANIDPFNIDDIKNQYAPTNGDVRQGNVDNEIDFNWKRYECLGKADYSEQRDYYLQGWRPILHSMFPGRFGPEDIEGPVIVKDMILMERPMRLTVKARQDEIDQATRMMRVNRETVGVTPEGSAPRVVYTNRTTREHVEIPE